LPSVSKHLKKKKKKKKKKKNRGKLKEELGIMISLWYLQTFADRFFRIL
jgi:hypothetical protein